MKVAAYQAPLPATCSLEIIDLIREQIAHCESLGVEILCCPEAVLGGLADYAANPTEFAINVENGQLQSILAPLASNRVATILGFTEIDEHRRLYNSAAVFYQGSILGIYRKHHPAIHQSIYHAGDKTPVFTIGDLTFGILICNDSNYDEPARTLASQGAAALFIPTNNGLPLAKATPKLIAQSAAADIALAREHRVSIIRADVAGQTNRLVSHGSSHILDHHRTNVRSAQPLTPALLVAEIEIIPSKLPRNFQVHRTVKT